MRVTLIDYTGAGTQDAGRYAANVLVFTKSTRLNMTPGLFHEVESKPWEEIEHELQYMARTIPSSWEFVDYTFLIEGVTRAFTHQFVRTRTGSYAQQTMRVLRMEGWDYAIGPSMSEPESPGRGSYVRAMDEISEAYDEMLADGVPEEDARGVLPTNILTNIVAKFDMRTLVGMVRSRSSPRTQDEYRRVLEAMKQKAREVHPWIDIFVERTADAAARELDRAIADLPVDRAEKTRLTKLVDELRKD